MRAMREPRAIDKETPVRDTQMKTIHSCRCESNIFQSPTKHKTDHALSQST